MHTFLKLWDLLNCIRYQTESQNIWFIHQCFSKSTCRKIFRFWSTMDPISIRHIDRLRHFLTNNTFVWGRIFQNNFSLKKVISHRIKNFAVEILIWWLVLKIMFDWISSLAISQWNSFEDHIISTSNRSRLGFIFLTCYSLSKHIIRLILNFWHEPIWFKTYTDRKQLLVLLSDK